MPHPEALRQSLDLAAESKPEARGVRPEQFVDAGYVEKLRADGLLRELWGTDTP